MSKNLITSAFTSSRARQVITDLTEDGCYLCVGNHLVVGGDAEAATPVDSVDDAQQIFSNLIAGTKLGAGDVVPMIERTTWAVDTVFEQYNRSVKTRCFAVVEQGSTKYVYKCLNNSGGAESTEVPSGTATVPFETSDGYVWQYMFTIDQTSFERFATDALIPFIEAPAVTTAAVGGTIDSVTIVDGGLNYTNTVSGTFRAEDISIGDATTYKLASTASSTNDFYKGCLIEIVTPLSPAFGEMVEITGYNGTTKLATLAAAFSQTPEISDQYEVSPGLSFTTNAVVDTPAKARALITNGQVSEIVVANRGAGYRTTTATVNAEAAVGATPAVVGVQASPEFGHGGDILSESYTVGVIAQKAVVMADLGTANTNDFRAASLLSQPTFSGVEVDLSSGNPERFADGEPIRLVKLKGSISGNVSFVSPTTFTGNTATLSIGDSVLITSGTQTLIVDITGIANTSSATATGNFAGTFTGSGQHVETTATATIRSGNGGGVILDDVLPLAATPSLIYGTTSRALDTATALDINGRSALTTFSQLTVLNGSDVTGTLTPDELVESDDGEVTGRVFLVDDLNEQVFLTNVVGTPTTQQYIGQSSGAVFDATSIVHGDLTTDSGHILMTSNFTPISIGSEQTLAAKLLIEF